MLILTRRVGESLMIGDDVTITVLGVKGNQVRVGVKAPGSRGTPRGNFNRIEEVSTEKEPLANQDWIDGSFLSSYSGHKLLQAK